MAEPRHGTKFRVRSRQRGRGAKLILYQICLYRDKLCQGCKICDPDRKWGIQWSSYQPCSDSCCACWGFTTIASLPLPLNSVPTRSKKTSAAVAAQPEPGWRNNPGLNFPDDQPVSARQPTSWLPCGYGNPGFRSTLHCRRQARPQRAVQQLDDLRTRAVLVGYQHHLAAVAPAGDDLGLEPRLLQIQPRPVRYQ